MPWRETPEQLARARAERPIVIDAPTGAIFAVFTPPDPDAPPADRCVVLLTRPRSHRNRMWIEGARRLAAKGFSALRFDYHGAGDSGGETARLDPNRPYREDLVAALRHLRSDLGVSRFVLGGSCFDARTALSAFVDEADAIDGLAFIAAPVTEPEDLATEDDPLRLSSSFLEHFPALVASRARALFLFGHEDPEYRSFRVAERTLWPRLDAATRARFEVVVWPGVVHTGTLEMTRQREILEHVIDWIESLHPGPARAARPPQEDAWTSA